MKYEYCKIYYHECDRCDDIYVNGRKSDRKCKICRNASKLRGHLRGRDLIYKRDGYRCYYCTKDLRKPGTSGITLDHIIPKIACGTDYADNLVTSCFDCNRIKGVRDFGFKAIKKEIRSRNKIYGVDPIYDKVWFRKR